uniref:Uncharacterized protein n=1 Tax=Physcomitrium patens TaxID=3218 RepID=A0A2K1L3T7_PHYPA|nr:hypothetical protein PHYPA_003474 [Physcomitrium patens]
MGIKDPDRHLVRALHPVWARVRDLCLRQLWKTYLLDEGVAQPGMAKQLSLSTILTRYCFPRFSASRFNVAVRETLLTGTLDTV